MVDGRLKIKIAPPHQEYRILLPTRDSMIPRVIHVFWSGPKNWFVNSCLERMSEVNPNWSVREYSNFDEAEQIDKFESLSIQGKTDWLRLCLLQKYGGVWLDATVLCNRSIEESFDVMETRVVGFECPIGKEILENWAFGARPHHPFIEAWKEEFARAIRMGFEAYKEQCGLEGSEIYDSLPYLSMHAAYVIVARYNPDSVCMQHSFDRNHGPFYFTHSEWKRGGIRPFAVLKLFLRDFRYPPLLKFTGETRAYALKIGNAIPVLPGSFFSRTLAYKFRPAYIVYVVILLALVLVMLICPGRRASFQER